MSRIVPSHDTILSATDGKLNICETEDTRPYHEDASLKIEVHDASELGSAREGVQHFCSQQGLSEERNGDLTLGVGEAIGNAIKHCGAGSVYAGVNEKCVWVGVLDHA